VAYVCIEEPEARNIIMTAASILSEYTKAKYIWCPQAMLYNRKYSLAVFLLPVHLPTVILCVYFLVVFLQQVSISLWLSSGPMAR
jgi:hypothetical protein